MLQQKTQAARLLSGRCTHAKTELLPTQLKGTFFNPKHVGILMTTPILHLFE